MKEGRDLFAYVLSSQAGLAGAIAALKGYQIAALISYAEGLPEDDGRDEVIGTALVVAAERYVQRARKKHAKRMRRVRKVL